MGTTQKMNKSPVLTRTVPKVVRPPDFSTQCFSVCAFSVRWAPHMTTTIYFCPAFNHPGCTGNAISVHSLILSSHVFFCLSVPSSYSFSFIVPCGRVFAKPEDLEV